MWGNRKILVNYTLVINFFLYDLKRELSYFVFQTSTEDMETSEATEIIEGTRHEVKQSFSDTRGDTFQSLFWG